MTSIVVRDIYGNTRNYSVYFRESFRVDGKVKKKDVHVAQISKGDYIYTPQ